VRLKSLAPVVGLSALLVATSIARPAAAQTGLGGAIGTTTTTLTTDDLRIVPQQEAGTAFTVFDLARFFNISNCQCATPVFLFFTFTTSGFAKRALLPQGTIEFWAGTACDDNTTGLRQTRCVPLALGGSAGNTVVLSAFANTGGIVVPTTAQVLSQNFGVSATSSGGGGTSGTSGVVGPAGPAACTTNQAFQTTIWALVKFSTSATTGYDATIQQQIDVDLSPPPVPVWNDIGGQFIGAAGGNEAVVTGWTGIDTSTTIDLLGYQILCDRGGALQVFKTGTYAPAYTTCPGMFTTTETLDTGIHTLDSAYVCSPLLSALATSYRTKILENGVTYGVAVVAIDQHYNVSTPDVTYGTPQKTLSFYEQYRNGDSANQQPGQQPDPGRATGGYCALGGASFTRLGDGVGAALIVVVGLALARRRQQGRRR
jgi:hypothetical protein